MNVGHEVVVIAMLQFSMVVQSNDVLPPNYSPSMVNGLCTPGRKWLSSDTVRHSFGQMNFLADNVGAAGVWNTEK